MLRVAALVSLVTVGLAGLALAAPAEDFAAGWKAWQTRRLTTLKKPYGWLALTGLHWLKPGANRIPGLPGVFELKDGQVTLVAAHEDGWGLGGRSVTRRLLASDASETPDRILNGSRAIMVISRSGRLGLRVWDSESPVRKGFKGIETFPPDPRWRITARWEAYPQPKPVEVPSAVGTSTHEIAPGRAWFKVDGKEVSLEPTQDGDSLFFVFKDRTAPKETYGAGRFLEAAAPRDGTVVLDFNRAYNPPCAFTAFATCPLPLPENVLPVRIEAGEKTWGPGN
ncbi:MAG: DUF1684 domain-containing protein [Anaeromyxobacteraceae bacterium]|nr:DUF1684 domain-containing protein [Anaeromyxobacteraceae bacterium]